MAKHNNNKGNKSNQFKNSGKKDLNLSSGSMGSNDDMSMSGEEGIFGKVKDKISDVTPSVDTLKSNLPSILQWGAVALGAVGVYALYKNREKITKFMDDQDIHLPFMKGSDVDASTNVASTGTANKGKSRGVNTVSPNTH